MVREDERPSCFFEMQTHTPRAIGPVAAKTQQRRAPSTLAAAASRGQGLCCLVLCVLGECVCVWSPTTSGTKGAGMAWYTQSGVCAHWEACGDQRRNYRGPPKRSTCPVATPRHKSLYIFTRLVHQHFWPVKMEQYTALAGEPATSLPITGVPGAANRRQSGVAKTPCYCNCNSFAHYK